MVNIRTSKICLDGAEHNAYLMIFLFRNQTIILSAEFDMDGDDDKKYQILRWKICKVPKEYEKRISKK